MFINGVHRVNRLAPSDNMVGPVLVIPDWIPTRIMSQLKFRKNLPWVFIALLFLGLLLPYPLLHSPETDTLSSVVKSGELVIATIAGPTTVYKGPDGSLRGFDHDLAEAFAGFLQVKPVFRFAGNMRELSGLLTTGKADMAIAGIQDTPDSRPLFLFSRPYKYVQHYVVYLRGGKRPKKLKHLFNREIEVPYDSGAVYILKELKKAHPKLNWSRTDDDYEVLLNDLWQGLVDLSVAPIDVLKVMQQHLPELGKGMALGNPGRLALAFSPQDSGAIARKAGDFLEAFKKSGGLKRLEQRYYDAAVKNSYFNLAHYNAEIDHTLPDYKSLFVKYGNKYHIDWRLLAAMAYQESQWKPEAVSPTGVEGIMMLTKGTAKLMNIDNRRDPEQSIRGGAQYIAQLRDRIASEVKEPDRTWMALAAYNVGLGHLLDARELARQTNRNPDFWSDLEQTLPLLANEEWAKKTRHGKARGREPVQYVNRIRSFYDILVKRDEEMKQDQPAVAQPSAL